MKKESGVTPTERRRSQAPRTSATDVRKATCSETLCGACPLVQSPSIEWPGAPTQRNAAPRSGELERELEADDIPVEGDGASQVAHREMRLEEAGRDGFVVIRRPVASGLPEVSARWANGW